MGTCLELVNQESVCRFGFNRRASAPKQQKELNEQKAKGNNMLGRKRKLTYPRRVALDYLRKLSVFVIFYQ